MPVYRYDPSIGTLNKADGTIYVGVDGKNQIYIAPSFLLLSWEKAVNYARAKTIQGHKRGAFHLPTLSELSLISVQWDHIRGKIALPQNSYGFDAWSSEKADKGENHHFVLTLGKMVEPSRTRSFGSKLDALAAFVRRQPA